VTDRTIARQGNRIDVVVAIFIMLKCSCSCSLLIDKISRLALIRMSRASNLARLQTRRTQPIATLFGGGKYGNHD
jgi:hypothetical protein